MAFSKKICVLFCSGVVLPLALNECLMRTQALQLRAAAPVITLTALTFKITITVPDGKKAGEKFRFTPAPGGSWSSGKELEVEVPVGVVSGQEFQVNVPSTAIEPLWKTDMSWPQLKLMGIVDKAGKTNFEKRLSARRTFYNSSANYEKHVADWKSENPTFTKADKDFDIRRYEQTALAGTAATPSASTVPAGPTPGVPSVQPPGVTIGASAAPAGVMHAPTPTPSYATQRTSRGSSRKSSSSSSSSTKSCSCGGFEPFFYGMLGALAVVGGLTGAIVCSENVQTQR